MTINLAACKAFTFSCRVVLEEMEHEFVSEERRPFDSMREGKRYRSPSCTSPSVNSSSKDTSLRVKVVSNCSVILTLSTYYSCLRTLKPLSLRSSQVTFLYLSNFSFVICLS
jgi:hypothetical protein